MAYSHPGQLIFEDINGPTQHSSGLQENIQHRTRLSQSAFSFTSVEWCSRENLTFLSSP